MEKKDVGWICKHPWYGTWFISRQAVINDWKEDHERFYGTREEPSGGAVEAWFAEQISWVEISAYGKQLERPDMTVIEKHWLGIMKSDTGWSEDVTELKGNNEYAKFNLR